MDALIPWQSLEDRVRPVYPEDGRGRHTYALSAMLRIHCVQLFYNPFGKLRTGSETPGWRAPVFTGAGSALRVRSGQAIRGSETLGSQPDETTILNFRHLLERRELGQGLLEEINAHLESQGLKLKERTIVDATIIV